MARNLVPDAIPLEIEYGPQRTSIARVDGAAAIVGIPSNAEVCRETLRFHRILSAQAYNGNLDEDTFSEAIARQFKVGITAAGFGTNAQIQNLIDVQEKTLATANGISARLDADRARFFNERISSLSGTDLRYRVVIKYTAGHPFPQAPAVPGVIFNDNYPIRSEPPRNLIPMTYTEIEQLAKSDLDVMRPILLGCYWFYNDQRLLVTADADLETCKRVVRELEGFLKYP